VDVGTTSRKSRFAYLIAAIVIAVIVALSPLPSVLLSFFSPTDVATRSIATNTTTTFTTSSKIQDTTTSISPSTVGVQTVSENTRTTSGNSATSTEFLSSEDWLTYNNYNSREGYSSFSSTFGSPTVRWRESVDAAVYAEPLYYDGQVYVATENNSIYALNRTSGSVVWSSHLGTPMNSLVPPLACDGNSPDILPTIGITGTPVIDPTTNTIYTAALVNNVGFVLFALNTNNGQQRWHETISANGFYYQAEEERGALALANGYVYIPFGGYSWACGPKNPTGWVIGMPSSGKGTSYSFHVPTIVEGDIWAPEGVSVGSSGSVYVATGDSNNRSFDLGDSVVRLTSNLSWTNSTANYFAATDWQYTNENDLDLGSTGATILPDSLIFSIGKDGIGYLLNGSNLGGIGGQLSSAYVCGKNGAWGSTSFYNNTIYVPCGSGIDALSLKMGAHPTFTSLWNRTGFFWGPPIIAGGVVLAVDINSGTLYALNLSTGAILGQLATGPVEHFTTPSLGGGLILVAASSTIYGIDP
jgi:outer membrane protein assembly factor BamB